MGFSLGVPSEPNEAAFVPEMIGAAMCRQRSRASDLTRPISTPVSIRHIGGPAIDARHSRLETSGVARQVRDAYLPSV